MYTYKRSIHIYSFSIVFEEEKRKMKTVSPNQKRRQLLSTTSKVNPKIEDGFTTTKAFWKLFKASMGFLPPSSGHIPVSDDGGYAKFR